jgi:hypothetical protein
MTSLLLTLLLFNQLQQPVLSTKLQAKKLTVGDPFYVELSLSASNQSKVLGPLADSLSSFAVLDQKNSTKSHQGYNDNIYRLKLACFKPGQQALPRFAFLVSTGDRIDTLRSDTLKVTIQSVMSKKMQDINDLKPEAKFPNYWLWLVPALLLVLAALVYTAYILLKKLRRMKEQALAPLPPWEEALLSLEKLPRKEWLAKGHIQSYYYALSEIIKRYIERRFGFNAVEQTTTEIIASMKAEKVPMRQEFAAFLSRADLVKYAKVLPPEDEINGIMDMLKDMINRTTPAPKPEAKAQVPDGTDNGGGK